jgi:hypothetical protein
MATTYRYAWLAVLNGKGRKNLNDQLLEIEEVNPALTQQNAPGAIWIIEWDNAPARLATTALSGNIGKDQDIEVVIVSVQGDEKKMRDWIETPQGKCLRSHALSVQPWVYSAMTA